MTDRSDGSLPGVPGYRILRPIGRGGFAVVHEAEQLSLGRRVALKMLRPDLASERDLRRFERERLLLAELSHHRHVVDVIDAGTASDGSPFIVMRLYRRGSLAQHLADRGTLPVGEVVGLVRKIASALQSAHGLGVVHRDVKPENVLIEDDGEPALADFGISVLTGPGLTTTGNLFTMAHAAPEVLQDGQHGIASDVYSLASTTYQLLSGRLAFTGPSHYAQMAAAVTQPTPPMARSDVPPAVEAVVRRGMAKSPMQRPASAIAFSEELTAAWEGTVRRPSARSATAYAPELPYPPPAGPAAAGSGATPTVAMSAAADPVRATVPAPARPAAAPPAAPLIPLQSGGAPRRSRRRRAVVLGAAVAVLVPATVTATYGLGVPPGSLLRRGAAAGATSVTLAMDVSLHGDVRERTAATQAVQLYLDQRAGTGRYRPTLHLDDVSTVAHTRWDGDACRSTALRQAGDPSVVAVIGPYNTGCARLAVPLLNAAPGGPVVAISHGSTDDALTTGYRPGRDPFYPTGRRSFASVVTSDPVQARAMASFAADQLSVGSVYVLDDGGAYGRGIAAAFAAAAEARGIRVVGRSGWSRTDADYRTLFSTVQAAAPDAVFLGGTVAANGVRLLQDKVAVLGDNRAVRLLAGDGFVGDPQLAALPAADGMFLTFPGLSPSSIRQRGGAGSQFLDAYQRRYGADPADPYAIYAVAAAQVLYAALEQSDGTREGVRRALFDGSGVTVPAAESVLGADLRLDPATGDVSLKDVTVETVRYGAETLEKVVTVP